MSSLRWLFVVSLFLLAWFDPLIGDRYLSKIERWGRFLSTNKLRVLFAIFLVSIIFRVAMLSLMPIPVPAVHDEFSHLLASDTFAHGRLANPPHPMWMYLDTFHVLQHPTYAAIFPPAPDWMLTLGRLLGHPWIGVLLGMAIMCVAITWAMQAWLPAEWALLGALLIFLRIYLFSYWLESYWGGAIAAIGGALVIGSVPLLKKRLQARYAVLMGIGALLLANSRPFEGFIFCLPVAAAFGIWIFSRSGPAQSIAWKRVVLPFLSILVLTVAFIGYYNWRVTEHVFLTPEALYVRKYINYRVFIWESLGPRLTYSNPQFEKYFNVFFRDSHHAWSPIWQSYSFWQFFVGVTLSIPLLAFPYLLRDKKMRLLLVQFVLCFLGFLLVAVGFLPHYAGPVTATFFILFVQAMRHMRRWQIRGRPIGVFLTRLVVLLALARTVMYFRHPPKMQEEWSVQRARIVKRLETSPNDHLVIVRYSPTHNVHQEWVYNAADIDHSKVVWAREIPGVDLSPLLAYFHGRTVWTVEPDHPDIQLRPYSGATAP